MNKFAVLGDSITKGTDYGGVTAVDTYAYLTGTALGYAPTDIINAGVSANTSGMALARLQVDVLSKGIGVVVVMLGPNDAEQNVPYGDYADNLRAIVAQSRTAGWHVVFLSPALWRGDSARHQKSRIYLEHSRYVASEFNVPFIDVTHHYAFDYLCDEAEWNSRYVPGDQIHQSKAGHAAISYILTRPAYAKYWVAPAIEEPVEPEPTNLKALVLALSDYVLGSAHPVLTATVLEERGKLNP